MRGIITTDIFHACQPFRITMPDDPKNPDSLDDDRTFAGEPDAPPDEQQSLGDVGTHGSGGDE